MPDVVVIKEPGKVVTVERPAVVTVQEPGEITVSPQPVQVAVEVPAERVQVVSVGVQGPPGYASGADAHYTHVQTTPAATWEIQHNLLKLVSVSVIDSAGTLVHGNVEYLDVNSCRLRFSAPFAGSAACN